MNFVSKLSLALALATGTALVSGAVAEPAFAKEKKEKPRKLKLSKDFQKIAGPLQGQIDGNDPTSARPGVEQLLAAGYTGDDQMAAGQLALALGGKLKDPALQLRGLETIIASGSASGEMLNFFTFHAGNLAYETKDYARSVQLLQPMWDSGYRENSVGVVLAQALFRTEQTAKGLAALEESIRLQEAANGKAPESWYQVGSINALQARDIPGFKRLTMGWAKHYPSANSWNDAIAAQRYGARGDAQLNLEVLRFMRTSGAMRNYQEFEEYAQEASKKYLWNDVVGVVTEGRNKGVIQADSNLVTEYLNPAKAKLASDRASLPTSPDAIRFQSSDDAEKKARIMMNYADNWLAYGDYAKAAAFYNQAMTVTPMAADRANVGLGSAHAMSGDYAAATTSFGKVTGAERKGLASLWLVWINQQNASSAATASAGS